MISIHQRIVAAGIASLLFLGRCCAGTVPTKTIFVLLGAPGSGKGSLSELCVKDFGFKTVSTGNLCRAMLASGSPEEKKMLESSKKDGLIPDEAIAQVTEAWLSKNMENTSIMLDGYPRTQKQAARLVDFLATKFSAWRLRVIDIQTWDVEELIRRVATRWICGSKECQIAYDIDTTKDKGPYLCTKCGNALIRRDDDAENVVRMRFNNFVQLNKEIVSFYVSKGIAVEPLNSSHVTVQDMFDSFKAMIGC